MFRVSVYAPGDDGKIDKRAVVVGKEAMEQNCMYTCSQMTGFLINDKQNAFYGLGVCVSVYVF